VFTGFETSPAGSALELIAESGVISAMPSRSSAVRAHRVPTGPAEGARTGNGRRGFTLVEIMIVVVIIGLLASMAIPAFQKVRTNSQDKAVLNNARQLSAAADQYYLENGVSTVTLTDLLGPTTYVKALNSVANEVYPLGFSQGATITVSGVAGVRTITYAP
jgi:type IV pilus assembly protein PilA